MTNSKIRLGVIGAGGIGDVHMSKFKQLSEVEVAAVTDVYLPMAWKRAEQHHIATVHTDAQALLEDPTLDAVVIAVPNKYHAPLAIEALHQGKHVLLEKPMATDSASARAIVDAKEQSGKILMMAHQMRWTGLSRAIKERIDQGALGEIYNVKTGWLRKKGIPGWGTWFTRKQESGGGPLIDIGVHMLDLSLYMMGNPRPISVYATTYAKFGPERRGIGDWGTPNWEGEYDVEDLATAMIRMDNGATLLLEVSWAGHLASLTQEPYLYLMGTEAGAAMVEWRASYVQHEGERIAEYELPPLDGEEDRMLMSRHFIECIQQNKEPISSAWSGYTNNRILDAIYESSRTGSEVKLNW